MPTAAWHELGAVDGTCTVCSTPGALSMGEARFTRSLPERLRREHVPTPARFVSCADCGWRWPVRSTDTTADAVRHRSPAPDDSAVRATDPVSHRGEPVAAALTVLPAPRDGRRRSRDWAYPRV
jgi:hypothetical protein